MLNELKNGINLIGWIWCVMLWVMWSVKQPHSNSLLLLLLLHPRTPFPSPPTTGQPSTPILHQNFTQKLWIKSLESSPQASRRRSTPSFRILRVLAEFTDTTVKSRARVGRVFIFEVSGPHYLSFMILEVVILMWWNKFQFYA
jgi:hypothetical protein